MEALFAGMISRLDLVIDILLNLSICDVFGHPFGDCFGTVFGSFTDGFQIVFGSYSDRVQITSGPFWTISVRPSMRPSGVGKYGETPSGALIFILSKYTNGVSRSAITLHRPRRKYWSRINSSYR